MWFDQQERKQFLTSLGWQVSGNISGIRPFGARLVGIRFEGGEQRHRGRVRWAEASRSRRKPDNSWALFNLGASTDVGNVAVLAGSATAGTAGNYWAVTLGLRAPL